MYVSSGASVDKARAGGQIDQVDETNAAHIIAANVVGLTGVPLRRTTYVVPVRGEESTALVSWTPQARFEARNTRLTSRPASRPSEQSAPSFPS